MKNKMLAMVYQGNGSAQLETRPVPALKASRDVIVRVTRSAICTSDIHIRNGAVPRAIPGVILGHEFVGEVVALGSAITTLQIGDRVAANCETFCGNCWFCRRGYVNNCEHGGWQLGCCIDGCQAEYVRVPYADMGLTKIPATVTDKDALFLGDILSSGYFGAELAEIKPGDTIAILGAGPVGLCAAQCAKLFGAETVICIDTNDFRLQVAKQNRLADLTINPATEDLLQIMQAIPQKHGADAVIEAAGGVDTFQTAWKIARPNGIVAIVAMYETPQVIPLPQMYGKNLTFKTGGVDACHCKTLIDLLENKRLHTNFLITHQAPLTQIEQGYHVFSNQLDNCLKWVVENDS